MNYTHLMNMEMEYANTKQKSMKPSSVCPLGPSRVNIKIFKVCLDPPHFDYPYTIGHEWCRVAQEWYYTIITY